MKRTLSIILSVIMIVLMVPFMVIPSAAANASGVNVNNPINGFTLYNNDLAEAGLDETKGTIWFQSKGALFLNADTGIGERTIKFQFRVLEAKVQNIVIQSTFIKPTDITTYRPTPEIFFGNMYNGEGTLKYRRVACTDSNGKSHSKVDETPYQPTTGTVDTASFGNKVGAIFTISIEIGADNYIDYVKFNAAYKNNGADVSSDWSYDWRDKNYNFGNYIGFGAMTKWVANSKYEMISVSVTDKDGKSLLPDYMSLPFSEWKEKIAGPVKAPANVKYELDDATSGLADGKVTVDLAEGHNTNKLSFYWGDDKGKLKGYTSLGSVDITSNSTRQVTYEMIPNTIIPPTATKLLVYPHGENGEGSECGAAELQGGSAYVLPSEKPLGEFYVMSDLHYGRNATCNTQAEIALKYIAENGKNSDGIFLVGDVINGGGVGSGGDTEIKQYGDFYDMFDSIRGLPDVYPAVGNHEWFGWYSSGKCDNEGYMEAFADNLREYYDHIDIDGDWNKPYYSVIVKGFKFIVLGPTKVTSSTEGYLGDEQIDWLKSELASLEDDRPVFIMLHMSMKNSVAQKLEDGSDDWADILDGEKLRAVLKEYPNVIMFNGHTHYSLTGRTVKHMMGGGDEFVTFNTASVKDNVQGYNVQVYSDRILVRGIDFETGEWIAKAQFVVNERYTGPQDNDNIDEPDVTTQPTANDTAEAPAATEASAKSGCKSTLSVFGVMLSSVIGSALVVSKRRKEDK